MVARILSLIAFLIIAPSAVWATASGIDTPPGVTALPLAVQGNEVMRLQDNRLGIGTTAPASKLHVYDGEIQMGSSGAECSAANAGALRWSGSAMQFCNGSSWQAFGGTLSTVKLDSNNGNWGGGGSNYASNNVYVTCPSGYTLTGGSCDFWRDGDGRELQPRYCRPYGNGYMCNEHNSGYCIAHIICSKIE